MCSAFRSFYPCNGITSRLNTFHLPKSASRVKMVYGLMVYLLGLIPRALSAWLCGSSLAACPSGLSLEYVHSIALKSALLYSKKKNNELFGDFTHLCNIYTINLYNGVDELVQHKQL